MPKSLAYFSLGMSIFFIFMAFFIIIRPPELLEGYPDSYRYIFALIILAYGLFRLSRAVKVVRNMHSDEEE